MISSAGHHLDRGGPLVRVHPDHHPWHVLTHNLPPFPLSNEVSGMGGHRFYEQSIPFLSLSRPSAVAGAAQSN